MNYKNWTSYIIKNTDKTLYDLYIPGSHNSGAKSNYLMFYTQDLSIKEQLNIGTRFLDLRLTKVNNVYYVSHYVNIILFSNVLDQILDFLNENYEELLIVRIYPDAEYKKSKEYNFYQFNTEIKSLLDFYGFDIVYASFIGNKPLKYELKLNKTIIIHNIDTGGWFDEFESSAWISKFKKFDINNRNRLPYNKIDAVFTFNYKFYIIMVFLILLVIVVSSILIWYIYKKEKLKFKKSTIISIISIISLIILAVQIFLTFCNIYVFNPIMHKLIKTTIIPRFVKTNNGTIISYDYVNESINKTIIELNF